MTVEEQKKEDLQKWIHELVFHFRTKIKQLARDEQLAASRTLYDLSEPCQFLIVWAKEPEFQIVIIFRLEQFNDAYIEIFGPIDNSKIVDYIDKEVLNSPLIKYAGKEKVIEYLVSALKNTRQYYDPIRGPPAPFIDGMMRIIFDNYVVGWLVIGSLLSFDSEKIAENFVIGIKSELKPPPPQPSPQLILEGFAAYIYPPVWVGELPMLKSFKEMMFEPPPFIYAFEKTIVDTYKGRPIVITKDGCIAIGEKDNLKARELLNEILGTLLLRGLTVQVIREIDLGQVSFTDSGGHFRWGPFSQRVPTAFYEPPPMSRITVETEKIKKTLRLAELLTEDDRIKTLLLLHLEAFSYFINTEYKQALIMAWIILEDFYVKDLWATHISKVTSDKNRQSKLWSWNIDQRLEALNLSNAISNDEYDLLMKIKDARNDVVHEGKFPNKEIVEKCVNLAIKIVKKYVGEHLGTKIVEL